MRPRCKRKKKPYSFSLKYQPISEKAAETLRSLIVFQQMHRVKEEKQVESPSQEGGPWLNFSIPTTQPVGWNPEGLYTSRKDESEIVETWH